MWRISRAVRWDNDEQLAYFQYNPDVRSGKGNVTKDFQHGLIKLDGVSGEQFGKTSGWGRVEFAYYLMAKDCEIEISDCKLLEQNDRAYFMTKRFDRDGNTKHHIQSLLDYNIMILMIWVAIAMSRYFKACDC